MTPPATATAPARRVTAPPDRLPAPGAPRRAPAPETKAPLRVVPAGAGRRRRRIPETLAVLILVGSLLVVVVGHAMLTTESVRLSASQSHLSAEQAVHRHDLLKVAQLETPSRIVAQAEQQLHMVPPTAVNQLRSVPLSTPVAAPDLAAPPTPVSAPGAASSGQ